VANLDVCGCGYVCEPSTGPGALCVERGEGVQGDRGAQSAQLGAGIISACGARAAYPVFAQWQVLGNVKVGVYVLRALGMSSNTLTLPFFSAFYQLGQNRDDFSYRGGSRAVHRFFFSWSDRGLSSFRGHSHTIARSCMSGVSSVKLLGKLPLLVWERDSLITPAQVTQRSLSRHAVHARSQVVVRGKLPRSLLMFVFLSINMPPHVVCPGWGV
jgi:hypothetical protein